MDLLVIFVLLIGFVAVGGMLAMLMKRMESKGNDPVKDMQEKQLLETLESLKGQMEKTSGENRRELNEKMDATIRQLTQQFADLNKSVDTRISKSTTDMNTRLDAASRVIGAVKGELGKMSEIRGAVDNLNSFLRHSKRRGGAGETALYELLADALPKEKWQRQYTFKSGETVDAAIHTANGLIPIDAKFPLDNFEKLRASAGTESEEQVRKEFIKGCKKEVDAISKKYILPSEGTTDFAIMYIPLQSVAAEALEDEQLEKHAREKRVQIVAPSSFFYFLRVILMAYQSERFEESARQVLNHIAAVKKESTVFGESLIKAAKQAGHTKQNIDEAVMGYEKLDAKIERVAELGSGEKTEALEEKN